MKRVKGKFITIDGERFYEIANYDAMKPFFISLASDTDLWMYLASTGGLTCGRRSPEEALFPYYTDDKITENYETTGPKTIINDWKPFSNEQQPFYEISRKIAKSTIGNQIVFCEENKTLGLRFSYLWAPAGKHGWVRRATIENLTKNPLHIDLHDMLLNILPAGVERKTQNEFSTLVDGYKKTEHIEGTSLVLFRMEAILVDRAEPSESLRCNTVYGLGLPRATYGETSKGVRGKFVAHSRFELAALGSQTWYNVLDVSKDACDVRDLIDFISRPKRAMNAIEKAMAESTNRLYDIVEQNDGVQQTGDEANDARHFANVLFNTMRGGYYLNYPPKGNETDDYLPLTFGRRHGDPSRPWNLFNIRVQDDQGNPIVAYQGNWRDIFQNWEALSFSYPLYVNNIIAKFLNCTTADGYNPYRVTNEGYDYEVIEPENPWSNIGYWGDHQIVYLLRLLELSYNHRPEVLHSLLNERAYTFANVPYRIKSYAELVADPKNGVRFDETAHQRILNHQAPKDVRTTMADKLLITLLTKLSNFVPNAGIWMNTLRPEWNDANNALVGYGASMVTLCYMRRYVAFLLKIIDEDITMGEQTAAFLRAIHEAVKAYHSPRAFIDAVGNAGEYYREAVYAERFGEQMSMSHNEVHEFLTDTLALIDTSIRANKREDGLYEAYNLIKFTDKDIEISHLYEMLEGQVAVLSSGLLSAEEAVQLLSDMRESDLFRADQNSYMLYPNRTRKTFLELNNIPAEAKSRPEVQKYIGSVIKEDRNGGLHFDAQYRNADKLPEELKPLYEEVFHHHAFTGRSGTFYKYEGLGCIYWHMVSKLLVAVGEIIEKNIAIASEQTTGELYAHYVLIRQGIGSHKSPEQYGSFPFDAYSHTPSMAGVQQPGLTGQVKEDIISRWFELGISVRDGQIHVNPRMLTTSDFVNGTLSFTYCGAQFIYSLQGDWKEGDATISRGNDSALSKEDSARIFAREPGIVINVHICKD